MKPINKSTPMRPWLKNIKVTFKIMYDMRGLMSYEIWKTVRDDITPPPAHGLIDVIKTELNVGLREMTEKKI